MPAGEFWGQQVRHESCKDASIPGGPPQQQGLARLSPGREPSFLPRLKGWHEAPLSVCRAEVSQVRGTHLGGST